MDSFMGGLLGFWVGFFLCSFLNDREEKRKAERQKARTLEDWQIKVDMDFARIREQLNRLEGRTAR